MGPRQRLPLSFMIVALFPALVLAVNVGTAAPAFSVPRVTGGGNVSLASLKGKVVVIDFWASWCEPCLKLFPEMDAIQREFSSKGVTVLAISIDEENEPAKAALGGSSRAFTPLLDADSKVSNSYGVGASLPATVVIDQSGTVRLFKAGGAVDRAKLRPTIRSLL